MSAQPVAGADASQAMQEEFVWSDRRRVGRWRAFWRVVGYALGTPSRIGKTMTRTRGLRGAIWFSFLCLMSTTINWQIFFTIGVLIPQFATQNRQVHFEFGTIIIAVLSVFAFSVGLVLVQQFSFIVWGIITHALIRMTGRSRHTLGHTLSATQYCAGTYILCVVPICGFYFSVVSLAWMAVAMVSALAALHKISRWRTALAVFLPQVVLFLLLAWLVFAMVPVVKEFLDTVNSKTPLNFPPLPTSSQPIVAPNAPMNAPPSNSTIAPVPAQPSTKTSASTILPAIQWLS